MKTIATAAVLMMLSAPAWADDADQQTNDPANTGEPIVLSEAELDGVSAGKKSVFIGVSSQIGLSLVSSTSTTSTSRSTNTDISVVGDFNSY